MWVIPFRRAHKHWCRRGRDAGFCFSELSGSRQNRFSSPGHGGCALVCLNTTAVESRKQLGLHCCSGFDSSWHRVLTWASVSAHRSRPLTWVLGLYPCVVPAQWPGQMTNNSFCLRETSWVHQSGWPGLPSLWSHLPAESGLDEETVYPWGACAATPRSA